jgi:putative oxidoreductase
MTKLLFNDFVGGRVALGLLILRGVAGLGMMFHGWGKIQQPFSWMGDGASIPGWLQALAALSEFGGGAAWVLGLLTPLACFGILCTMAKAVHLHAVTLQQPFVGKDGSYELALLYLVVAVLLLLAGPGKLALDAAIFGRKKS